MNTNRRVNYKNSSDQGLVDLFERLGDRVALAELYERYRVSIGNYLYRYIKNKTSVTDTFNTIMLSLVTNPSDQADGRKVATKLFAMAYEFRLEHLSQKDQNSALQAAATKTQEESKFERKLASLPRLHADILELVYRYNFAFDEAAEIIGCTTLDIRNCFSHIKKQHRAFFVGSITSKMRVEDKLNHGEVRGHPQIRSASIT